MKKLVLFLICVCFPATGWAETLRLKSGSILDGMVVDKADAYVRIKRGQILWTVDHGTAPEKDEYSFQDIPVNDGVTVPAYQYRWDVVDITFNIDPVSEEIFDEEIIRKNIDVHPLKKYYDNKTLRLEGTLHQGYAEGLFREYYPSGAVKAEINFSQGKQHGERKDFHPNRKPRMICEFKNGVPDGLCRTFNVNGSPILEVRYLDGRLEELTNVYYNNGNVFYAMDADGREVEYDENGNIKLEKSGEGAKLYWNDGTLRREVKYTMLPDGRIKGDYVDYERGGQVLNRYSRVTQEYDFYMQEGKNYEREGNWVEAIRSYQQAYHVSPEAQAVNMSIGTVYFKAGEPQTALPFLEKAASLAPNHILARMAAGAANRMLKQYDAAIDYFEQAQKLDPNSHLPMLEIGRTFYAQGKMEEARVYFKKALSIKPNDTEAYEGLRLTEIKK